MNNLMRRALASFLIGVGICSVFAISRFLLRDAWFTSSIGSQLISAKGWVWPTAILDVVFSESMPSVAAAALYLSNGVIYTIVAIALFALRSRPSIYVMLSVTFYALVIWFNVLILETFSWLGSLSVLGALVFLGVIDLRRRYD